MERRLVHYEGRVQGVGFRFTTHHIASGFDVTGFVRNLPDGRVEVVAEGETDELRRFFAAVAERMQDNIRGCSTDTLAASGEFARFEIRH